MEDEAARESKTVDVTYGHQSVVIHEARRTVVRIVRVSNRRRGQDSYRE